MLRLHTPLLGPKGKRATRQAADGTGPMRRSGSVATLPLWKTTSWPYSRVQLSGPAHDPAAPERWGQGLSLNRLKADVQGKDIP